MKLCHRKREILSRLELQSHSLCRRKPKRLKGKRHLHWFQSPQKQQLIRQKRKKYRRRFRSYSNLQTKFHHQCSCRRRFDYHSGLLRTWCGPENSERYRGWIEKEILGCR